MRVNAQRPAPMLCPPKASAPTRRVDGLLTRRPRTKDGRPTEQADSTSLAAAISTPGDEPYRALPRCRTRALAVAQHQPPPTFQGTKSISPPAGSYHRQVAYDEELAARLRQLLADEPDVTEMKMFGGLAFLVGGNIAVAASGQGGVLVRVEPSSSVALLKRTNAQPMVMRGREMPGWLQVDSADVRTKRQLLGWVERGVDYARSLPSKR